RATVPKWLRLAKLWFVGEERWKACSYAAATIVLALTTTGLLVKISYAQRDFSTALSGKNAEGFYRAIREFVLIICLAAPLFSFTKFVEDRMVLAWRAYLTRLLLQAYFKDKAFFRLGLSSGSSADPLIFPTSTFSKSPASSKANSDASSSNLDNPDQRICDDVGAFVQSSTTITLALCKKLFNCAAFAGVLWSVSGQLVVFLFVYAGVGTLVTTSVFGKVLMRLFYTLLALEGDMRYALVRVRESAESIAFYGGEKAEARLVHSRLVAVLSAAATRIRVTGYYDLWTSMYQYATILVPSLLTAPRYFAGEIEFGTISQTSFAFSSINQALSIIITNLGQITGLAAETDRLDVLLTALESHHQANQGASAAHSAARHSTIKRHLSPEEQGLSLKNLTVNLPGRPNEALCEDLSLRLDPGHSLLIVGASGCGKSSLLRALAGLWTQGSGTATMPVRTFFLPQKPFMPLGTLRHQLLFPSAEPCDSTTKASCALLRHMHHLVLLASGSSAAPDPERAPLLQQSHVTASPKHQFPGHLSSALGGAHKAGANSGLAFITVSSGGAGTLGGKAVAGDEDTVAKSSSMELSHTEALQRRSGQNGGGGGGGGGYGGGEKGGLEGGSGAFMGAPMLSDAQLHELLEDVRLEDLVQKVGGFDAQCDWSQLLSSGEQQRVAILRLLAHAPQLAFLDECTSAVDGHLEAILYSLLRARCPCYVSVGHRMQLLHYHTHVLEFREDESGKGPSRSWALCTAQEFQQRLQKGAATEGLSVV
ncbi:ABC transporter transmembrane region 2-domain-containing protein, partial [Dunaliella salina]